MAGATTLQPPNMDCGGSYMSAAVEEKKAVAAGHGWLNHIALTNVKGSTVYVFIYDGTSTSGTLIYPPIAVTTKGHVSIPLDYGVKFVTGLYVASSSDVAYTATTTADLWIRAGYQLASG